MDYADVNPSFVCAREAPVAFTKSFPPHTIKYVGKIEEVTQREVVEGIAQVGSASHA